MNGVVDGRCNVTRVAKLFVIRHADAGSRSGHDGPDERRPLSKRGVRQAGGIQASLADEDIKRLVASPYLRCVQTLEPLADHLGLEVEVDDRLAEGAGAAGALELATELKAGAAAVCSHGDVIPDVLEALQARGTRLKDELRWQKASTWVLTWNGSDLARGRYVPPPG